MDDLISQERANVVRMKEIYDAALAQLMTGALPVDIFIKYDKVKHISSLIIQDNLDMITSDIIIYVFAIESGKEPSNYLANIYVKSSIGDSKPFKANEIATNFVIKHYELPTLLEKSYKVKPNKPYTE